MIKGKERLRERRKQREKIKGRVGEPLPVPRLWMRKASLIYHELVNTFESSRVLY